MKGGPHAHLLEEVDGGGRGSLALLGVNISGVAVGLPEPARAACWVRGEVQELRQ